ncbi:hypothetical protein BDZ89DRAFT_1075104 [Hymenopellis radicata]|nr:hypothetical protein BDZ89DRAFT_1075104 [Hymenopellis radicata]
MNEVDMEEREEQLEEEWETEEETRNDAPEKALQRDPLPPSGASLSRSARSTCRCPPPLEISCTTTPSYSLGLLSLLTPLSDLSTPASPSFPHAYLYDTPFASNALMPNACSIPSNSTTGASNHTRPTSRTPQLNAPPSKIQHLSLLPYFVYCRALTCSARRVRTARGRL